MQYAFKGEQKEHLCASILRFRRFHLEIRSSSGVDDDFRIKARRKVYTAIAIYISTSPYLVFENRCSLKFDAKM